LESKIQILNKLITLENFSISFFIPESKSAHIFSVFGTLLLQILINSFFEFKEINSIFLNKYFIIKPIDFIYPLMPIQPIFKIFEAVQPKKHLQASVTFSEIGFVPLVIPANQITFVPLPAQKLN
jgi:hypothetical protein